MPDAGLRTIVGANNPAAGGIRGKQRDTKESKFIRPVDHLPASLDIVKERSSIANNPSFIRTDHCYLVQKISSLLGKQPPASLGIVEKRSPIANGPTIVRRNHYNAVEVMACRAFCLHPDTSNLVKNGAHAANGPGLTTRQHGNAIENICNRAEHRCPLTSDIVNDATIGVRIRGREQRGQRPERGGLDNSWPVRYGRMVIAANGPAIGGRAHRNGVQIIRCPAAYLRPRPSAFMFQPAGIANTPDIA